MPVDHKELLCPDHLRDVTTTLRMAVRLTGMTPRGLLYACEQGLLQATPFPSGNHKVSWQVRLGALVDYTRKPLDPEWLTVVEACLAWKPGETIARVA